VTVRVVDAIEGALFRSPKYSAAIVSLAEAPPVLNNDRTLPLLGTVYTGLLNVPAALLVMIRLPARPLPLTAAVQETEPLPTTTVVWLQLSVAEVVPCSGVPPKFILLMRPMSICIRAGGSGAYCRSATYD
jgi:hypothetical protein